MSPYNQTDHTKRKTLKVSKFRKYERQDSQILPWPNDEKIAYTTEKKSLETPF